MSVQWMTDADAALAAASASKKAILLDFTAAPT
jgi:hypothetical protein